MTRVALVTSSFLPRFGGVEEHVLNVARELRAAGDEVVVWAVDQRDEGVPDAVDGILVRYLPTPMPARSWGALARFGLASPRALARWLHAARQDRPEVLHVHCYGPNGPWADLVSRLTRTPLLLSAHGETFMDAHDVFSTSAVMRRALTSSIGSAAAVTACSRYAAADLTRFGADPAHVVDVPNGIDLDERAGSPPAGLPPRYLLAVGRLVRVKGFDLLLGAYARARAEGLPPDLALVLGGDGPERAPLARRVEELGLGDSVVMTGRLSRPQVVATMAGACALVVPSRVEAFGITVLEGWRAGVPVVVTSVGGPPGFVRDGYDGLLVDPRDEAALASALLRLAGDPELGRRLGPAGRRRVEDLTWDRAAAAYRSLYAGLVRPGAGAPAAR